jgi:ABC-type uncharacterized transport system substrate-binding protein
LQFRSITDATTGVHRGLGSAAAWPAVAGAQQPGRVRRVGVLTPYAENDPVAKGWLSEFVRGLSELGWTDDRTIRMEVRWAAGNLSRLSMLAKELIQLQPDVILAGTTPAAIALHRETQAIPIVFVLVLDPIGEGFVASMARPGGNMTGFITLEATMGGKWLELLTRIAPGIQRAGIMFNPDTAPYAKAFLPSFEQGARLLNVESIPAPVHSGAEIETVITSLGREPRGGLVVVPDSFLVPRTALIISLAARHNVPTINNDGFFPKAGGLLSYGPAIEREFYRAAFYVARILSGAKPADLPVQLPIKLDMVLNAQTARLLGLNVPETLVATADEVIQ